MKMVDLQANKISSPTSVADLPKPFKLPKPVNGVKHITSPGSPKSVTNGPTNGLIPKQEAITWAQRKHRMDTALAWLKSEMTLLRIHDKLIEAQFQQVHNTITAIKKEREEMRRRKRSFSLETELDEDEDHWEDWEIKEFEESYHEEIGMSLDSRMIAASREVRNANLRRVKQPATTPEEQQTQQSQQARRIEVQQLPQSQHQTLQEIHVYHTTQSHTAFRVTIPRRDPKTVV